jgi:uncharacterized membrane protein
MESGNDSLANGAARLSGMFNRVWKHLRRHPWFYLALACGAAAWLATGALPRNVRLAVTGDTFYLAYLILTASFVVRVPTDRFRDWIDDRDEGLIIVTLVTLAAVAFSLVSIFTLLNAGHKLSGAYLGLSLASAPLGWFALHTVAALHYAHFYYAARAIEGPGPDSGGLCFPGTDNPGPWDFLYYSFVVGMTAQVSDVQVVSTPMRRLTMLHGIISFMFNTVLIALAVNTVVALVQAP